MMMSKDKILKETSPLSILFVKSSSRGNRLLFRYPYDDGGGSVQPDGTLDTESFVLQQQTSNEADWTQYRNIIAEADETLCNIFSVRPNLCGHKFEIKINNVRHVGHPISLLPSKASKSSVSNSTETPQPRHTDHHQCSAPNQSSQDGKASQQNKNSNNEVRQGDITSFNIVCALRSSASYDTVDCYHDLSKRLAIALSFEERRCSYLTHEVRAMLSALDEREMANLANNDAMSSRDLDNLNNNKELYSENTNESVYGEILRRSSLARDLKRVYLSLCTTGIVELKINGWVSVSFCLPQKVHRLKLITHQAMPAISDRDIKRCLSYLRPYHGFLMLQDPKELLDSLPIDASPAFIQLIKVANPEKNFMDLSVDANLTLMQIYCIVSQLVYWAKVTIIYPICDSNIYAIHPLASTAIRSQLVKDFKAKFPRNKFLAHYLANFSEGTSLSQLNNPLLKMEEKANLLNIVIWLLQRRILTQIHKYVFLMVSRDAQQKTNRIHVSAATISPNNNGNCCISNHLMLPGSSVGRQNGENDHVHEFSIPVSKHLLSQNNLPEISPANMRESFTESFGSSTRRFTADSFADSQDDSNFGLNSSLSSTPNSNIDSVSPNTNDIHVAGLSHGHSSLTTAGSCPLDEVLGNVGSESIYLAMSRAGLTRTEVRNILSIPSSRNPDDLKLLVRLLPYFNGKHHIEDIMFFENLERSQILILCDKFRHVLFTCHYEDVAVSQLSPFTK